VVRAPKLNVTREPAPESWALLGQRILTDPGFPTAVDGPAPITGAGDPAQVAPAPGDDPSTGVLARLFAHHEALDARAVAECLRPIPLSDLEGQGLLARHGTDVSARFGVERWGPVLVVHDWPEWHGDPDYVMGTTNAGRSLTWLTPTAPVGVVLDLGTGCALQAVMAAHHAHRVVAVDINERAVALARASVLLNGLTNVDVRHGSWFEPVDGETFDLIVSNPPFVISPEHRLVYRDGGREGDDLCGELLADMAPHLAPGGVAVMLVEWARRRGEEWSSTPLRWLGELDVDGLGIRYGAMDPLSYATRWNAAAHDDRRAGERAVREWLGYYDGLGIDQMYEGVIALRRHLPGVDRAPASWVMSASRPLNGPGGDQLAAALDGHSTTEGRSGEELLAAVAHPVEGHSLYQEIGFAGGTYVMGQIRGGFGSGIGVDVVVAPEELPVILALDGERTIGDVLEGVAAGGIGAGPALDLVVRMAQAGLVELTFPATGPGSPSIRH